MFDKGGQVAVILIIVVAAALIFYAVSLNLGRISQTKVMTTVAADTAASTLASYMASFGQSVFQTSLGGKKKICGWTGIIAAILTVIIAIIAVVLVATGVLAGPGAMLLASISLVLALGALAMQIMVIQPGLTEAWNDILWHSMEMRDAFVEQGVQRALSGAATDRVLVPDLDDSDGDRLWGIDGGGQPLDEVSRFGFYYTQRRLNTIPIPVAGSVQDFLDHLRDFLTDDGDNWGLVDEPPQCDPFSANSECNPCCILWNYWTEEMGCAADADPDPDIYTPKLIGVASVESMRATCEAGSPYGDGVNSNYPWVYDPYRENPLNNVDPMSPDFFISFREQLGRDDEHQLFEKNPAAPNNTQISVLPPPPPLPPTNFQLKDTTNFYVPLVYPPNDNRTGVFPFFYKIVDWGVNLDPAALVINNPANPQCNWCDAGAPGGTACDLALQPTEIPQLNLPIDPADPSLVYNKTYCVDGTNPNPGNPPLAVDLVRLPDPADLIIPWAAGIGKIEADIDQCAQNAVGDPNYGFWKRGGDRFCSNTPPDGWPYWGECPKYGSCPEVIDPDTGETVDPGCACGEARAMTADNWPDDLPDDLVYGLNFFANWAKELLAGDAALLGKEFKNWYPEAAQWIEPGQSNVPIPINDPSCTSTACCYVCDAEDGALYKWYQAIREMKNRLQAWRDTSFAGTQCREVWCVPPAGCPGVPAGEAATFDNNDTNGDGIPDGPNGIRGDFEDVVNCLNWNANVNGGNANRFNMCKTGCENGLVDNFAQANTWCSALPRSLVPGFDTTAYIPANISELVTCRDNLNANCGGNPALTCTAYGTTYVCSDAAAVIPAAIAGRIAAGSCAATGPGGFKTLVDQSLPEAANQVAKFRQRYNYLSGRLNELNGIISILDGAEQRFNDFLTCADVNPADGQPDGAACRLIKARIDLDRKETGLPYHAIYGWQDEPQPGDPPGSGKWHLVRADARIPAKCDRACGESQLVGSDPGWPYVRTYTKSWGTKRCYELSRTTGVVKARVTRFDETGRFSTLLFSNAVEIWKPTFERGDRPSYSGNINNDITAACANSDIMIPGPGAILDPSSYYYGAFILNKRVDNAGYLACLAACAGDPACEATCTPGNEACWDLANELLSRGVTSEACARYYFHNGTPKGMDFQFVPCQDF